MHMAIERSEHYRSVLAIHYVCLQNTAVHAPKILECFWHYKNIVTLSVYNTIATGKVGCRYI